MSVGDVPANLKSLSALGQVFMRSPSVQCGVQKGDVPNLSHSRT